MPWNCKLCGQEATDDLLECPGCQGLKTAWTLQEEVTRTFTVSAGLRVLGTEPDTEGRLTVRLDIDPNDPVAADDRFILFSSSGDFAEQVRSIADDQTPDDDTTDLLFEGLDRSLRYSLEVDPGAQGSPYLIFDDQPFAELAGTSEPLEVVWKAAERAPATDKGTLRDLSHRGAAPRPDRLLRVRSKKPVAVTPLFAAQAAEEQVFEPEDGEVLLILAFGPGSLEGVSLPGVHVVDVSEETEAGHAPILEISQGSGRPKELPIEGPDGGRLIVRLEVDPNDAQSADDKFILSSKKGKFATQVKTVHDDLTPNDATTDLLFLGLDESASYTLEVDPGAGGVPYRVFDGVPYAELSGQPAPAAE